MKKAWYLFFAALFCLFLIFALDIFDWVIDDLFIYFRYVNNFIAGEGIVFNPGEHVEGFSSFCWFLILSLFRFLNLPLELSSKIASLTFSFLSAILVFKISIVRGLGKYSFISCILMLFNLPFILWSVSGFEIMFYIFLLLLCLYKLLTLKSGSRQSILLSILIFLVSISRPEGIMFSAAFLIYAFFNVGKTYAFRTSLVYGFLMSGFLLFRFFYFGDFLQNTYYAKIGHNIFGYYELRSYKNGMFYILDFFMNNFQFAMIFLLMPPVYKKLRSDKFVHFLLMMIVLQFVFVIFAGGDWMGQYRFIIPAIPFLSIAIAISMKELSVKYNFSPVKQIIVSLVVVLAVSGILLTSDYTVIDKEIVLWNNVKKISGDIAVHIPPNELTAIGSSGIIPATLTNNKFIDIVGLTDEYIARNGRRHGTWFERSLPEYVYGKNPEWLVMWKKRNNSGIYNFKNANPVYYDMALDSNFSRYSFFKSYDVYDDDRIELYRLNKN